MSQYVGHLFIVRVESKGGVCVPERSRSASWVTYLKPCPRRADVSRLLLTFSDSREWPRTCDRQTDRPTVTAESGRGFVTDRQTDRQTDSDSREWTWWNRWSGGEPTSLLPCRSSTCHSSDGQHFNDQQVSHRPPTPPPGELLLAHAIFMSLYRPTKEHYVQT